MGDIHIDDFYKDAAKVLAQLYNSFPRKTILYVEDIAGPDTPDEFGLHSERHQACFSTMIWLAEANYLTYGEAIRQEALDQACLSHKGFTLLSTRSTFATDPLNGVGDGSAPLPDSVKAVEQSNISQLRQALKSRSSSRIRQCVQQLLLQARHYA